MLLTELLFCLFSFRLTWPHDIFSVLERGHQPVPERAPVGTGFPTNQAAATQTPPISSILYVVMWVGAPTHYKREGHLLIHPSYLNSNL